MPPLHVQSAIALLRHTLIMTGKGLSFSRKKCLEILYSEIYINFYKQN